MKSLHTLLDEIEPVWREEVRQNHYLRSDTPLIRNKKTNQKDLRSGRDWTMSTDLSNIFADIFNDESLQRKFETIIAPLWDGDPETLARDTLHYLLDHELYHPIEAPFSTRKSTGNEDNDNTHIHQAIRRGILQAEPDLSPDDQFAKVSAAQNAIKDFILDNRVYLDKQGRSYQDDIIPTWDVLELHDSAPKTNFYTITRLLYGVFYGTESTHDFFQEKAGKEGKELAEKAMTALLGKAVTLPTKQEDSSLVSKIKSFFTSTPNEDEQQDNELQSYITAIREVFSGEDRYKGIERFMAVLGPYVEKGMPQGRPDLQGEGSGGTSQDILQDLLDDMTPEDQAEFTQNLSDPKGEGFSYSEGEANSSNGENSSNDQLDTLDLFTLHEFYKRNHPSVKIVGGNKVGKTEIVGKEEYWDLVRSEIITEDGLGKLNLSYVAKFQQKTGKPMLIPLDGKLFRFNEYELKQRDVKDIVFVDEQLNVPDEVDIYVDSSGSMYDTEGNKFGFNDGSRWDMSSQVIYGFIDALHQGGQQLNTSTTIRIHNVGNRQVDSKAITIEQFLAGDKDVLETIFKPANGYNHEDLNVYVPNDNLKRATVVVTDGNLVISGRTEREAKKMKELGKSSQHDVVLFEIGGTYDLGNAVKSDPNVHYNPVHDKEKMLQQGVEVLLGK
jgi:hypothetical protein